jgi:hypothetical protein
MVHNQEEKRRIEKRREEQEQGRGRSESQSKEKKNDILTSCEIRPSIRSPIGTL